MGKREGERRVPKRGATMKRTPRTRSKFKAEDPEKQEKNLKETLAQMGLYVSTTVGDGNCMFRALSDQVYGHPGRHGEIRQQVCDYLEEHEDDYLLFVISDDSEEPKDAFERHVSSMRQNATYGSHLELSIFARMSKRSIKVIQPGMVYVVGDEDESPAALKQRQQEQARRAQEGKGKAKETDAQDDTYPLYIIYHGSYEHYSSARNVNGPHTGKPEINIAEKPASTSSVASTSTHTTDSILVPTDDEKLVMSSLPDPEAHTLAEIRELIESTGSWEAALEQLQEQDIAPSTPDRVDSATSSPLSSTPSSPLLTATRPEEPDLLTAEQERPSLSKRSLSDSLNAASIASTPPTKRASTRSTKRDASPSPTPDSEEDEFEDVDEPVPEPEREARYTLRNRQVTGQTGKEKRLAKKAEKHQQR